MMNNDVKQKWLAALRSGNYTQGAMRLHKNGAYCCLGVLCDIAVKDGVIPDPSPYVGYPDTTIDSYQYGDGEHGYNHATLPYSVQEWAGLEGANPLVGTSSLRGIEDEDLLDSTASLAEINDSGMVDFAGIADIIEKEL